MTGNFLDKIDLFSQYNFDFKEDFHYPGIYSLTKMNVVYIRILALF